MRRHGWPIACTSAQRRPGLDTATHSPPTRADLVPKDVLAAWLKHLREELPTLPFKSSTQQQARNLSHKQVKADVSASLHGSECLGVQGAGPRCHGLGLARARASIVL